MIMTVARSLPLWVLLPTTVCLSAVVGWLDYHASEVQGTVLVLLVISAALSFAAPTRAWMVAVIMGLSVSGTYVVGRILGTAPVYPIPVPASTLIALIPAAIGAACGAGARLAIRTTQLL